MPALKFYLRNPLDPPRIAPETWRTRAACLGHPKLSPETWDDRVGADDEREDTAERTHRITKAQDVCASCPVREPCWDETDPTLDDGVRGGVDLRQWRAQQRAGLSPEALAALAAERAAKYAERRRVDAERRHVKAACDYCGGSYSRGNLLRHLRAQHGETA